MASYYEEETSGYNPDRFADDLQQSKCDEVSALTKIKGKFWTTKQLLCDKLGLPAADDDGQQVEMDPEFDGLLEKFKSVQTSTSLLVSCLLKYHKNINDIVDAEQDVGEFLETESHSEKEHLKNILKTTTLSLSILSKERLKLLWPVSRIHHELLMFDERAVEDCKDTVEAAKTSHSEYRGSLLWMKSIKQLDPERKDRGMDEFRVAQQTFKRAKSRFDQLKEDLLYKVDVLEDSRRKLLEDLAKEYSDSLVNFYETSCAELNSEHELPDANTYEIEIAKILAKASFSKASAARRPVEEVARVEEEARPYHAKEEMAAAEENLITMDDVDVGSEFISAFEEFLSATSSTHQKSSIGEGTTTNDDIQKRKTSLTTNEENTKRNLSKANDGENSASKSRSSPLIELD